jgi:hypothetical protein
MKDLMKKFNMAELKPVSTPMSTATVLDPDKNGEAIDQRGYSGMICSLLHLTVTRWDIPFTVCLCACFQASPHSSHRTTIQQIFRYLIYILEFEIWYSASLLDLVGFSDADFVGCGIDRKSTSGTCHFLDLLLFVGQLTNSLLSQNPPHSQSM